MHTSNNFKLNYHQQLAEIFTRRLLYDKITNEKEKALVKQRLAYHTAELLLLKKLQAQTKIISTQPQFVKQRQLQTA